MYSSENAGLQKFDLLTLNSYHSDETLKRLKTKNRNLDINKINQNDKNVFSTVYG